MGPKSELRDGMRIDWDVPITLDDGVVLRADIFRPPQEGKYPVILTYGPYAKGLAFQEGYPDQWKRMAKEHPDVTEGSTNKYQNWEVVDPEKWYPTGMSVCGSIPVAPAARPDMSTIFHPGRLGIFSSVLSGPESSGGAMAR